MHSDATALADAIRVGKTTARETMQASIASAQKHAPLGSIFHLDSKKGNEAASQFDAAGKDGSTNIQPPFGGVPSLVKDLGGPFLGFPVRAGSKAIDLADGKADSVLAEKMRESGLCFFGTTTTPEFGLSLVCEPDIGPHCRNPLNPDLTPGGSSGGAAAAVAAGIVSIAHATDAGGSIRVPAACCGLVGLKPSRGAISGGPSYGNHIGGLASEFAVCRSVRDAAALFEAILGDTKGPFPPLENKIENHSEIRIGLLTTTGSRHPTNSERSAAVEAAGKSLEARGHTLVSLDWSELAPLAEDSARSFAAIICVNLAALFTHAGFEIAKAERITQAAIARGGHYSGTELWELQNKMVFVSRDLWRLFDRFDCLLAPMLAKQPLPLGSMPTDHDDLDSHFDRMTAFSPLATLANVSGFSAITLPFGADPNQLPLPVQFIAPMGNETLLLSLAEQLEAEGRWQHRFAIAGLA